MNEDRAPVTRRMFLGAVGAAAVVVAKSRTGVFAAEAQAAAPFAGATLLSDGWQMQSSEAVKATGDALSKPDYAPIGWYSVSVPTTVLAGLVASGEYPDIYYAENLKKVPIARFRVPWWYRKTFTVPNAAAAGTQVWLHFKGINYRANIWLNGQQIADASKAVGAYRDLEFNITAAVAGRVQNVLAVEVTGPKKDRDLSITFVDWAPQPPDLNMGIWQDVELRTSGPVALRNPHVLTDLDVPSLASAKLTVLADLVNATDHPVTGTLEARVDQLRFTQAVQLAPRETKTVELPAQTMSNARIWWPWQLGKPEMHSLALSFTVNGVVSDQSTTNFGVRKVASRLDKGHLLFTVNGVDLLIMGAGYCPDLLQRRVMPDRPSWQEDHVRYVRDMNLNTIRLEGKLEDDAFFDICDRHGMLVMAGWCCCSPWEQWNKWKDEQHAVAEESLRYQIRKLRTHPSLLVWLNGSDNHPPKDVEEKYLAIESELKWPCPTISSATAKKSPASGATGVKMEGPYKWEPPIYWLTDKKKGGAWGFNTEVGPGPVPPPLESLEKMLPPEHRWPIDAMWNYHCGSGKTFDNITDFTDALDARFGKPTNIADFAWKSQAQAYETIRAMYEGFRRNKFTSATGEIQWMLNNAWPSLIWHLYDYYWRPGGAYFATKTACEPLHVLYSYDDQSIVVANNSLKAFENLAVTTQVYDPQAKLLHEHSGACAVAANATSVAYTLPKLESLPVTYFVRLTLADASQQVISVNCYFLSTKPDVLAQKASDKDDWNITRCTSYADVTALEKLPKATLTVQQLAVDRSRDEHEARVHVSNTSAAIALMVRLKLTRGDGGEEVLPIRWDDNYFMLLPGEKREIAARWMPNDLGDAKPTVTVDCFNNARGA
ncbi:MAG TPA: glycoside hydrolase family 2 protein [Tepidisphaeraceae bacterium]|nr:glycoside hydrolase family 2 protein [Tepidisphaeraceae bacterium]